MEPADFRALLPALVVLATSFLVTVQTAVKRGHGFAATMTSLGIVASLPALLSASAETPRQIGSLMVVDDFSLFFAGLILTAGLITAIVAYNYLSRQQEHREEFYIVLLLAVLGALVLVSSTHFISLFLGLELMTVSLYVMIAYLRGSDFCLEAGIKYLILAAASSAFLLFGLALLYAALGTMSFAGVIAGFREGHQLFLLVGTALFLVGAGFKLALVPFHMWTPDVYQGAPAPVTGFIATVSKGAVFGLLLRYFFAVDTYAQENIITVLGIIAGASMIVGNIMALLQRDVKRLLAYSSIAHLGYMLVAFIAGGDAALEAVSYYLVAYFATILGAFAIVAILSDSEGEPGDLDHYRGLFWSRPGLALAFTFTLLSLAGIPLTGGFVGKFLAVVAGADAGLWLLLVILALSSVAGIYYYLRVVTAMYQRPETEPRTASVKLPLAGQVLLVLLVLGIVYFGVYPAHLLTLIRNTVLVIS
jgi:NADH-quinone oxidoreductase subunit N